MDIWIVNYKTWGSYMISMVDEDFHHKKNWLDPTFNAWVSLRRNRR